MNTQVSCMGLMMITVLIIGFFAQAAAEKPAGSRPKFLDPPTFVYLHPFFSETKTEFTCSQELMGVIVQTMTDVELQSRSKVEEKKKQVELEKITGQEMCSASLTGLVPWVQLHDLTSLPSATIQEKQAQHPRR